MTGHTLILAVVLIVACAAPFARAADIDLGPPEPGQPVPTSADAPASSSSAVAISTAPAPDTASPAPVTSERAPAANVIRGTILPARLVRSVRLVERDARLSRRVDYDSATGRFEIRDLPPGVWALEVETPWGRAEGVDLRFRPAALDKLAPPDPSKPADAAPPPPLDDEDRAEIRRHITDVERFMTARDLLIVGDGREATALVELIRDTPFHGRQGDEVVWRLEVWYYRDAWGKWERVAGAAIFRERVPGNDYRSWTRQFFGELGGLEIRPGATTPLVVTWTVPDAPSPSRGPVASPAPPAPAATPPSQ